MSLQGSVMLSLLLYPLTYFLLYLDSHILDFEIFSENHNFMLIKQIIFSYTKIRLHYFNKQFNKNLKGKSVRLLFCSTLSEFENFLLRERILINVTTCRNETSS
jgi:hypothetical protein